MVGASYSEYIIVLGRKTVLHLKVKVGVKGLAEAGSSSDKRLCGSC